MAWASTSKRRLVVVGLAAVTASGGVIAGMAAAERQDRPRGTLSTTGGSSSPESQSAEEFVANLPPRIPVLGNGGEVVGYVDKKEHLRRPIFDANGRPLPDPPDVVRDENGRKIGYIGPDGFVADSSERRPSPVTTAAG